MTRHQGIVEASSRMIPTRLRAGLHRGDEVVDEREIVGHEVALERQVVLLGVIRTQEYDGHLRARK